MPSWADCFLGCTCVIPKQTHGSQGKPFTSGPTGFGLQSLIISNPNCSSLFCTLISTCCSKTQVMGVTITSFDHGGDFSPADRTLKSHVTSYGLIVITSRHLAPLSSVWFSRHDPYTEITSLLHMVLSDSAFAPAHVCTLISTWGGSFSFLPPRFSLWPSVGL